jgi:hypothetical protein
MGIRYDEDVIDSEWADLRRAIRALFRVVYGSAPKITHRRTRNDVRPDEERWHAISLTAPATGSRNRVDFRIQASRKVRCYLSIIEGLHEKLDDGQYDFDQDDWIVGATQGEGLGVPRPGKVLWLEECPLFPYPKDGEPAIRGQTFKYVRGGLVPGYIRVQKSIDGVLVTCKGHRFDWRTFTKAHMAKHWGEGTYSLDLMSTAESNHGEDTRMLTRTLTIGEDEGATGLPFPASPSAWRDVDEAPASVASAAIPAAVSGTEVG